MDKDNFFDRHLLMPCVAVAWVLLVPGMMVLASYFPEQVRNGGPIWLVLAPWIIAFWWAAFTQKKPWE